MFVVLILSLVGFYGNIYFSVFCVVLCVVYPFLPLFFEGETA